MTQNKNKEKHLQSQLAVRFLEKRFKAPVWEKGDERAQLEDLLIALADRRSFPETLSLVERGMVGDTCSTESVVVGLFPPSVLTLPVNDPERDADCWQKNEEITNN